MKTKFSKIILAVFLILFITLSSTVSATDNTSPDSVTSSDNIVSVSNNVDGNNSVGNTSSSTGGNSTAPSDPTDNVVSHTVGNEVEGSTVVNETISQSTDDEITDAADMSSLDEDVLASYETDYEFVDSDLYLFDVNLDISQVVDGNVFAYGQTVNVSGEINGDLFVFASNLTIEESAIIHGNVFALASDMTVSGIAADVYAMADNFSLSEKSIIARNLYLSSNNISLEGQVSRDAYIAANTLKIAENDEPVIEGNLTYSSTSEAQINEASVGGEIKYNAVQVDNSARVWSVVSNLISALVLSFIVIMILLWIAPKFKDNICEIIAKKSFLSFGIGLLVFFATIIAAIILLLFTYGFGASTAVVAIAFLILGYVLSSTVFSIALGKLLANKFGFTKNVAYVLLSLLIVLIVNLIRYIPYVGGPIGFIIAMIGLGIICVNAYKREKKVK